MSRYEARESVAGICRYRFGGGIAVPVRIEDLTPRGCRLSSIPRVLAVGDEITLTIDSLAPIVAMVKWVVPGISAGLAFGTPLYPAVYDWLLSRMSKAG